MVDGMERILVPIRGMIVKLGAIALHVKCDSFLPLDPSVKMTIEQLSAFASGPFAMFRLPRRQIVGQTTVSLATLHELICEHLQSSEELEDDYNGYVMDYHLFMNKQSGESGGERATVRAAYLEQVASKYADDISEVADALSAIQRARHPRERCEDCGGYLLVAPGSETCEQCGVTAPRSDDTISAVPFGISVDSSRFPYRRSHHFSEWLSQIQGRESTSIPDEDIERIKEQIRKERLNVRTMDTKRLRTVLKTLRLQRLYEHSAYLLHQLGGPQPTQLPHELEQTFKQWFASIQAPFSRHVKTVCPQRSNFLSYSFVLQKFCIKANRPDLARTFSQLKSREKLILQDKIWKLICADPEVQWEFVPSV